MNHKKITVSIGESIREGKYLSITYKNKQDEVKSFWISILDITSNDKIVVDMFNVMKDEPLLKRTISISSIQSAELLKFSHYEVPVQLLQKINEDESLQVYEFDRYDNSILNYYLECNRANNDPFLHKTHLIPEIDLEVLTEQSPYSLSNKQQKHIIKEIYNNEYNKFYDYKLALCEFSIDIEGRGKFVVAYRELTYDPVKKTILVSKTTQFNPSFYIKDVKYTLSYYTDCSPSDFEELYLNNKQETMHLLMGDFKSGELLNTRPEVVVLGYSKIDIAPIFDRINEEHENQEMQIPLKAFFKNASLLDRKNRKEPHIVLYDNNVNIDQLRTIYNSLKYPVTYVQGPPGTGKTQTILNIVVNCLTNAKTLLITSNNNVPIDGIKEKLNIGKYRDKEILFPFIRLGNKQCTLEALQRIKKLYEFQTSDVPKEALLHNLKENSKEKNRQLVNKLQDYEERTDLLQNLEFVEGLLAKGKYWLLEQEREKLQNKINSIPITTDEDVKGIFEIIQGNHRLLQFFYYESLKYIKRLKGKDYIELIEILHIEEENEQIKEFNNWLSDDKNIEKLTKVFPIIITTNISSRRLGRKFKFDLLTIDEAGQCDIPNSLIPISKCKNMVLIGDTNQLKPIIVFDEEKNEKLMKQFNVDKEYDYYNNSILSSYKKIDTISREILLSYHYRCGAKIIDYSNKRFYEQRLNLTAVKTSGNVKLLTVSNVNQMQKNAQLDEAVALINYIKRNNLTDVFILTPFRNQEEVINHYLNEAKEKGEISNAVHCGTIHKVQGQENKTIIISTALSTKTSQRTYNWIKNNSELLNVGVTRAKENLIVITDPKAINILSQKDDDLYALIAYAHHNGNTEIAQSEVNKFTIGFSNNSKFEDEFYKTMQHYCSLKDTRFKRNVKIIELFPEERNNPLVNKKEFDGVLLQNNQPKVIFELNGTEHYHNKKTIKSDILKKELLASKNVQLLFIPNQYVKHYEFIRELINKFNGDVFQKTLFDGYDAV
ncbi:MAG: DNA helicase [Flavobacterium sp.]|uniref:DEAD/DEAH box helicase n=1 Tax=Flavobacterium sp. TaxID=239 RepID=UPI000C6909B7|nr:ATP-binding protein [Flavobacterium sp.]MBF02435.1 DNA helicase [Flavobacterium sp.]